MGVYIKGMPMPEACSECTINCKAYWEYEGWRPVEERLDGCPLVEVPEPHGRLIDADFEEKHYASMTINPTPDVTPQDYMHSGYAAKAFQMAKTVIEAEGDNYDYERASDMRDYCEMYEPTYNPEDGSM